MLHLLYRDVFLSFEGDSMFDQMLSIKKPFGKEDIELYGNEAARAFLDEGTSLNEKIASIANREELNNDQIQRIVEEANTVVDIAKGGESFELAKQASVIIMLRKKPEAELPTSDYDEAPCQHAEESSDIGFKELFGMNGESKSDLDPSIVPAQKRLHIKIIKLGAAREELAGQLSNLELQKETAIKKYAQAVEQEHYENPANIPSVFAIMKLAFHKESSPLITLANEYLKSKELIEKTASIAPEDLISENLKNKAIIQNGEHKIMKAVSTIRDIEADTDRVKNSVFKLDEEIGKAKEELKAL